MTHEPHTIALLLLIKKNTAKYVLLYILYAIEDK